MMQQGVGVAAPLGCQKRIHDQCGIAIHLHGPADNSSGELVKERGDIDSAFCIPGLGQPRQLLLDSSIRLKFPRHQVVGHDGSCPVVLR